MIRRKHVMIPEEFWKKIKIESTLKGMNMTQYMEECARSKDSLRETINRKDKDKERKRFIHGF